MDEPCSARQSLFSQGLTQKGDCGTWSGSKSVQRALDRGRATGRVSQPGGKRRAAGTWHAAECGSDWETGYLRGGSGGGVVTRCGCHACNNRGKGSLSMASHAGRAITVDHLSVCFQKVDHHCKIYLSKFVTPTTPMRNSSPSFNVVL